MWSTIKESFEKFQQLLEEDAENNEEEELGIPSLELCSALLLSQLVNSVASALRIKPKNIFLWSDSMIKLTWISASQISGSSVANRVREIQRLTYTARWNHIKFEDNSVELISRGVQPSKLKEATLWWSGSTWLRFSSENWPLTTRVVLEIIPEERTMKTKSFVASNIQFQNYSLWYRFTGTTAYIFRFSYNIKTRSKGKEKRSGNLTTEEIQQATIYWYQEGVLRIGGRLRHSSRSYDKKHPILFPKQHHITKLIAKYLHISNLHIDPQALLTITRQRYWPLSGKNLCKKIVHSCIVCFKAKPNFQSPLMSQLSSARITPSRSFNNTGIDFCGPVYIRQSTNKRTCKVKTYIVVFVCMAVKAVHLNLVSDLSTNAFTAALKRFIARRGHQKQGEPWSNVSTRSYQVTFHPSKCPSYRWLLGGMCEIVFKEP
ncbi:uncharacterized protein LOC126902034 [Daktulosphaira vitifoliae]|uniref:uncharacterized protein LOC126902034 n=1 Tax=Daktulosphaira vitifoliae TaxID=58002 RepID=UPI0021A9FDB9|nr:uncharacterized protein LOC126902034 [Daktulosphaira vitifoliae]